MNEIKNKMIAQAINRHNRIFPCKTCSSLEDSFTFENGKVIFWYNTEDQSTHLVVEAL